MPRFLGRYLLIFSFIGALTACQSTMDLFTKPVFNELADAELLFANRLENKQLDLAAQQLDELQVIYPDEPRVEILQQHLAQAWLVVGEQALQMSDMETASAALIQAKRLLPQAPALTTGLSEALMKAQTPPAKDVPQAVKQPAPRKKTTTKTTSVVSKPKANAEPTTGGKDVESASEVSDIAEPAQTVIEPFIFQRSKAKSSMIDPNAEQTVIPMPMLSQRNNYSLGRLLDDVAQDVVRFRATVTIEVVDTRDFHWVAALLSTRVKKLDANFKPRLREVIRSDQPAQLIITPNITL
ncbi:hypothetical protein TOI97_10600 [Denitrificimonas sp. JX-1]|uniref:Lipoprotein n=1 Tax=Denitrificimonas halotolerans TaxID=3098930 RepID=A0ABU5GSP6_9GAMM|nr:hypothetical protein [Denitrificimonas sp. JX-1]MDY7220011.1 hypothetical protein [Denitrificimonas sp. JX-1]